jgi:hypothetical protein
VRFFLLKLIHHISMVILRWLHLGLLFQHTYFLFKRIDFKLQMIILFTYNSITRFYKYLLNIEMLTLSTKSININVIASITTVASGRFSSIEITRGISRGN